MERLQKFMAAAGVGSRRYSEELILEGRVKVNGVVVTALGTKVDPHSDIVKVDDRVIKKLGELVYVILNKPTGVVTTASDELGRTTVMELVAGVGERIYPVGRLDFNTEGLLMLTNDGELAYRLTHPRFKVEKTYVAEVDGHPDSKTMQALSKGVQIEDGLTAPARVSLVKTKPQTSVIRITIHEGRKRQVRRMLKAVGHPVVTLRRVAFGPLSLGDLPDGVWRHLTAQEVEALKTAVGL